MNPTIIEPMRPGIRATLDAVAALRSAQVRFPAQVPSVAPISVDQRTERLGRILLGAHPALTPAHDDDPETLWAWIRHARSTKYLRNAVTRKAQREWERRFFGVLPNIEYMYDLLQREELWHRARMATLPPAAQDAYLDRLEARQRMEQELSSLPIGTGAAALLNTVVAAASADAGEARTQWTGQPSVSAFVHASENLVGAIAASEVRAARDVAQCVKLNAMVLEFARAAVEMVAEATPVIVNAYAAPVTAKRAIADRISVACNTHLLPGIALAASHLASPDEQAAEVARWRSHGWGLVPRSAQLAWWLMDLVCWANCHAPESNPGAVGLRVELARAWEPVDNALDSLGDWHD